MNEKDLFRRCFEAWGIQAQLFMLIEESAELIQSCCKDLYRNNPARSLRQRVDHFAEEIADVQIMIDEFIWKFDLEEDIKKHRVLKLERLAKKLSK